ncbi:MAG: hypothetical protein MR017_06820 [Paraprevotella sp.]|nr:hypothetical protein [Paraprevotella sp.]
MKKILTMLMLSAVMAVYCLPGYSQTEQKEQKRELLAERQANHIAGKLAFDDATTTKFVATYKQYLNEIWSLSPKRGMRKDANKTNRTEAETEQLIKQRFATSQKRLAIREKYYGKYREFLNPKQIERVYQIEKEIMNRLSKNKGKANKGNRPQKKDFRN